MMKNSFTINTKDNKGLLTETDLFRLVAKKLLKE